MRFGENYLRVGKGKSSEFYMFESAIERNEFARRLAEQRQNEGDTRSYEEIIASEDMAIGDSVRSLREDITDASSMLKGIFNLLEMNSVANPNTGRVSISDVDVIKDQVYQMYLMTLPEQDMRKRFTHRQGRTGFSADAIRTFIATQHTAANQLSRLAYSEQIRNAIGSSYTELAGNPDALKLSAFVDEMAIKASAQMEAKIEGQDGFGAAIARGGNQAAFYFFLSSVKSALVQMTQLPLVAYWVLGADYGHIETTKTIAGYSKLWNRLGLSKYNEDGELITNWGKPSINDSSYVNNHPDPEYREALRAAWLHAENKNILTSTFAADMTARGKSPTRSQESAFAMGRKAAANFLSGAFHHSERITREVIYMSAFELELARLRNRNVPMAEAVNRAVEKAEGLLLEGAFDYTEFGKPRAMTFHPLARLPTQFMTFTIQMTSYLIRNFYGMLPFLNREGKKAAATQFFGSLMMTYAFAGVTGLPMYSFVMGVLEGFRDMLRPDEDSPEADELYDKDDEDNPLGKRNLDLWFRLSFIPNYFGKDSALANALGLTDEQASTLARGVVVGPIPAITDLNIGSSVSLNNMFFQDSTPSDRYQDVFPNFLVSSTGPAGGVVDSFAKALDAFDAGDWAKGAEALLPAGISKPIAAFRLSKEGDLTSLGATVKGPEFYTLGKVIAQAAGFQSTEVSDMKKVNFLLRQQVREVKKERADVLDNLNKANMRYENNPTDENYEAFEDAIKEIDSYNYRNGVTGYAIDNKTVERSLGNRAKNRGIASMLGGLNASEKDLPLVLPRLERVR